ncbi:sugar ABC transporter substrate-binding protein [Devosia pacifica]|uniref:Sugar ABC transporter substrate-binding protein n=1 Tax=Devosia pacifica TaxID=1335967 RepID=A0A918S447_9HYPH|nr:extracellular solute-binding protein [Devosia pacifica]GHA22024.1 sugar ABC transporter substrate-binding protein [Devosia pacifica]
MLKKLNATLAMGGATALALSLAAPAYAQDQVELTWLVDNGPSTVDIAEALVAAYEEKNPNVSIELEIRPGGGEGDNIVKTRLATGEMTDIFVYNSGSLLQAIAPQQTLMPLTDQPFMDNVQEAFQSVVSTDGEVFGVPYGAAQGGGILYNSAIYEELGLEVPQTWDAFMENNSAIDEAGYIPVIQTFRESWTSQIFVLADFYNVLQAEPDFAERYTNNEAKYATSEAAQKGFERLAAIHEAGYTNEDFNALGYQEGLEMLANKEGAHYPMITFAIPSLETNYPDQVDDIGFFALPGDDADSNGLTTWMPAGVYVPQTTSNPEVAMDFLGFIASVEGCEAMIDAVGANGPYLIEGCGLPDDVVPAVRDMLPYFEEGRVEPALEFLSPIKGPALEQITVEVGSGFRDPASAAELYDQDVRKQAQQLGLEGW